MVPSRQATWRELPGSAKAFIWIVCLIGAGIIVHCLPMAAATDRAVALTLILGAVPASMVKASLPHGRSTLTLGLVLDYLTLLILGPEAAVLVTAVGGWAQCTFRSRLKNPLHQTLFSVAALVCSVFTAGLTYVRLGGHPGTFTPGTMFVPFATAVTVYFILNSGLVASAIGLTTGQSPVTIWSDSFLWIWPSYLLGAAVAAAVVNGVQRGEFWLLAFLGVPLALTVQNLQAYFERFQDSVTDPLTGLSNQRAVAQYASRALVKARRRGTRVAVSLIDVDGFKAINDTYGHSAGDGALCHVARRLLESVRVHDGCSRYGGDEFLIVLPGSTFDEAAAAVERLRDGVNQAPFAFRNRVIDVCISVGTAVYPDDGETFEQLLDAADARMYQSRRTDRFRRGA